jgi:hypothetical protein
MKFGQTWAATTALLPPHLRQTSISYKEWKKRTRATASASTAFIADIARDCARVDAVFRGMVEDQYPESSWSWPWPWRCSLSFPLPPLQVLAYAELQRTCCYKICKRFDKATGGRAGASWLVRAKAEGTFAFLGGAMLARLTIDATGAVNECPVCLDANMDVILECGHGLCTPCFDGVYGIGKKCGMLHNLIATANISRPTPQCPMCRRRQPLLSVDRYHFLHNEPSVWSRGLTR